jgi:hypothetical protein
MNIWEFYDVREAQTRRIQSDSIRFIDGGLAFFNNDNETLVLAIPAGNWHELKEILQ